MKFKWLFFILFAVSILNSAQALEERSERHINVESHGFGMGGSIFETWGFVYRHYLPSNIGIVANLGGWLTENYGHLGLATGVSYTLAHHFFPNSGLPSSSLRVYGIAYLAGIFRQSNWGISSGDGKYESTKRLSFDLGLGVGPGAEYYFTRNFAINLELPWMTFFKFAKKSASFKSSYPHIGGGISYYF